MTKIIQDYKNCIGCGTCVALCGDFWEMDNDNKARPKGGKLNEERNYELEIEEKDLDCNKQAVQGCPVQIIKIL